MSAFTVDVLIVGGGVGGSCTAIHLRSLLPSSSVLVVDSRPSSFKVGESLPANVKPLLGRLGVREIIDKDVKEGIHLLSYGNQSSWGSERVGSADSLFNPYGHGYHLDRIAFEDSLLCHAECKGVQVWRDAKVVELIRNDGEIYSWTAVSKSGEEETTIRCKILVNAAGRNSIIHNKIGIERVAYDKLIAFVGIFGDSDGQDRYFHTFVEACQDGWWYTTLLPSNTRLVVFHTDDDLPVAKRCRKEFVKMMMNTKHIKNLISKHQYKPVHQRIMCQSANSVLHSSIASANQSWISVGDGAMSFDPLSSNGMQSAMQWGIKCAQVLEKCLNGTDQEKAVELFEQYESGMKAYFKEYLGGRKHFYAKETRWKGEPFWMRRH